LATRCDRGKAMLDKDVSANFSPPAPLAEILAYLKRQAGVEIVVDRSALRAAGLADDLTASLKVQKKPLAEALAQLLDPLALGYRVVDGRTIQVTTRKALLARLELEFYKVEGLPSNAKAASALIEQIKSRVGGSTWSDAGGAGVIHFDPASKCLIVLQSQPVQIALEALLADKPH
jgi:hypothetical protein